MVYFASEVLGSSYFAPRWSRANFFSVLLYLSTVIVPALVLYSISNAWP